MLVTCPAMTMLGTSMPAMMAAVIRFHDVLQDIFGGAIAPAQLQSCFKACAIVNLM
jgi:hypothetical protein